MNWRDLDRALAPSGLFVMGVAQEDGDQIGMIGAGPRMWPLFKASAEYMDSDPDPLDRWSKRAIRPHASAMQGEAVFPSDGPPFAPFIAWASATGRFWQSPSGMLVHDVAGLMISIRGAIRTKGAVAGQNVPSPSPCKTCRDQPCRTACPVDALSAQKGYDVPACRAFLDTADGLDCLQNGCKARRACPISQSFTRDPEQSAFHMRSFHPT